ncbi:MAG: hypothetical protein ACI9FG_001195, partial [Crocinitomicaceae bacterium]
KHEDDPLVGAEATLYCFTSTRKKGFAGFPYKEEYSKYSPDSGNEFHVPSLEGIEIIVKERDL